jgi:hypothetical protein
MFLDEIYPNLIEQIQLQESLPPNNQLLSSYFIFSTTISYIYMLFLDNTIYLKDQVPSVNAQLNPDTNQTTDTTTRQTSIGVNSTALFGENLSNDPNYPMSINKIFFSNYLL